MGKVDYSLEQELLETRIDEVQTILNDITRYGLKYAVDVFSLISRRLNELHQEQIDGTQLPKLR